MATTEPTPIPEAVIDAAQTAFYDQLIAGGVPASVPEHWRDEVTAALEAYRAHPTTERQVAAGVTAALATLNDHDTGAGSDLDAVHEEGDGYVYLAGNVDLPQLVRVILEAGR